MFSRRGPGPEYIAGSFLAALLKMQFLGITDDEIVNVYEYVSMARLKTAVQIRS